MAVAEGSLKKVAVIGAGPAGMTAAYQISKNKRFAVTLFEKSSSVGGLAKSIKLWDQTVGIALKTKDLTGARNFYSTIIGLDEAFTVKNPLGGSDLTTFKINERQYVYVSADLQDDAESRLWYVSFETSDARALRTYLAGKGVAVPAASSTSLHRSRFST